MIRADSLKVRDRIVDHDGNVVSVSELTRAGEDRVAVFVGMRRELLGILPVDAEVELEGEDHDGER